MVIVRGLTTAVGEYGILRKGQTKEVRPSIAKYLEKEGIAEIVTEDDGKEPAEKKISGGVRITDVTGNIQTTDQGRVINKETVITDEGVKKLGEPVPGEGSEVPRKDLKVEEPEKAEKPKPEPAETKKKEYK